MKRRTALRIGGSIAAGGLATLAGCLGDNAPPPRKSSVIEEVALDGSDTLLVQPESGGDRWVTTRRDIDDPNISPVGLASAAKGRGATGRGSGGYSSAPKSSKGRAILFGGGYRGRYYDDHDDEIDRYKVRIATLGVAYLGTNEEFEEQDPGPGPVPWDQTYDEPTEPIETSLQGVPEGWYRTGANVVTDDPEVGRNVDLGWECVDCRVESTGSGKEITEKWKVSPRL